MVLRNVIHRCPLCVPVSSEVNPIHILNSISLRQFVKLFSHIYMGPEGDRVIQQCIKNIMHQNLFIKVCGRGPCSLRISHNSHHWTSFRKFRIQSLVRCVCRFLLLSGWSLNFYQKQILGNASVFAVSDLMYKLTITLMVSVSMV